MESLKILVVDDEARMRKLVKDFLTNKGFQVIEAGDGEEAVDIFFADKDIALVLLDVMMPKMDGWEVLKTIRKYSQVPVIDQRTIAVIQPPAAVQAKPPAVVPDSVIVAATNPGDSASRRKGLAVEAARRQNAILAHQHFLRPAVLLSLLRVLRRTFFHDILHVIDKAAYYFTGK